MTNNSLLRIAMWSGPRNISTAMMRSWENRPDTFVCDEPFYAHYLWHTKMAHPGADEIMGHYETDWRKVVDWLTGDIPEGKAIFYQKQMTHHLLPHLERRWLDQVVNCFLIREPREVITSYLRTVPNPTLEDIGLPQQMEIFDWVCQRTGTVPPVLHAKDVLENPRRMLELLCDALAVEFTERMLSWPPGRRPSDGIWGKHWYHAVENSTSFQPYKPKPDQVPEHLAKLHEQCQGYYNKLYQHRLLP